MASQVMPNDIILPEKEHVGLSILLVAGGVDNEVEAAKYSCKFLAATRYEYAALRMIIFHTTILK